MNVSHLLYLSIRVLHVLLAAVWLGSSVLLGRFLLPVIDSMGAAGGDVMAGLSARKLNAFFGAVGGLTIVSGIYLFWHFTAGFDPAISATRGGMCFTIGAACGLVAAIVGGSIVGRSAEKAVALGARLATAPEAERAAIQQQIVAARARVRSAGAVVELLLIVAIITMALGHYV